MPSFSSEFTTIGEKVSRRTQSPQSGVFAKQQRERTFANLGGTTLFFYLGIAYLEGKGVRASIPTARKLFQRANIDNDHPAAHSVLQELRRS